MHFNYHKSDGSLSFIDSQGTGIIYKSAGTWVRFTDTGGKTKKVSLVSTGSKVEEESYSDVHGQGRQVVIYNSPGLERIALTYRINTYHDQSFVLLQLTITNLSTQPIYLDEFCLFHVDPATGGKMLIAGSPGELRFFKVGWHGWSHTGLFCINDRNSRRLSDLLAGKSYTNPVTPRVYSPGEFWSEGWGVFTGRDSAILAGFSSMKHQFGQVHACLLPGRESMSLLTQADGVRLDPDETCSSEWGFLQFIPLPNPEPSLDYIKAVARQMGARIPTSSPVTWTHWYQFFHDISEELFLENLNSLEAHHDSIPFQVVELDDGYQSAWGDWMSTNPRFPHGLDALATAIRKKGFTPGLWLAPFTVEPGAMVHQQHPDWLLKNKRGKPVNAGFLYGRFMHALDTSHPAVLEHLHQLVDRITHECGFGMLKLDFLNTAAMPGRRYNPKLTRSESIRIGLEAIRVGAGEGTFLLGCGCPFGPAIGVVDAMRIGPDTAPSWEPYFHWLAWAGKLIKNEPSPPSLRNAIRNTLNLSTLHQRWWWNDPDCLMVRDRDTRLTQAEVQSAVTLVGLSGGMFVLSDDLGQINPQRLQWASLLIPNLGQRGLPVDWLEREMPSVYQSRFQLGGKHWQMVALFNWEDHPADCIMQFQHLGFTLGRNLHVFNFWNGRYFQTVQPQVIFPDIPAHGCVLIRVCEAGEAPQLVGDTLHISGGAEIQSSSVVDGVWMLKTIDFGRKVDGDLWLMLSRKPLTAICNGKQVELNDIANGVYRMPVRFLGLGKIEVVL